MNMHSAIGFVQSLNITTDPRTNAIRKAFIERNPGLHYTYDKWSMLYSYYLQGWTAATAHALEGWPSAEKETRDLMNRALQR